MGMATWRQTEIHLSDMAHEEVRLSYDTGLTWIKHDLVDPDDLT